VIAQLARRRAFERGAESVVADRDHITITIIYTAINIIHIVVIIIDINVFLSLVATAHR
jgi:hypothetical protein